MPLRVLERYCEVYCFIKHAIGRFTHHVSDIRFLSTKIQGFQSYERTEAIRLMDLTKDGIERNCDAKSSQKEP